MFYIPFIGVPEGVVKVPPPEENDVVYSEAEDGKPKPIPVAEFAKYCKTKSSNGGIVLREEFKARFYLHSQLLLHWFLTLYCVHSYSVLTIPDCKNNNLQQQKIAIETGFRQINDPPPPLPMLLINCIIGKKNIKNSITFVRLI